MRPQDMTPEERQKYWTDLFVRHFTRGNMVARETTFDALIPDHLKKEQDKGEQQ